METDFADPNEGKRATHFTVGALPWKLAELLEGVTPANVHPEYDPAHECEDSEPEREED
jgi:hypothetical protein